MALAAFDPYSTPLSINSSDVEEPRIFLFPLSFSSVSASGLPREFRHSALEPVGNLPMSSPQKVEPSPYDEIAELRRRLEDIKRRRVEQRERTLALQRQEEQIEEVANVPIREPFPHQPRPEVTKSNNMAQQELAAPAVTRRRPSISSETAGETIDISMTSSAPPMLHPKRLFCFGFKAKTARPLVRQLAPQDRSQSPKPTRPTPPPCPENEEAGVTKLDSLVCVRENPEDPPDVSLCGGRQPDKATEKNHREECFDPYQSRGNFRGTENPTDHLAHVPRGRARSVIGEEEDVSTLMDVVPSKSCMPRRAPAWYERPDTIETDRSDLEARVMELVFYANDPHESFDTLMQLAIGGLVGEE